MTENCGKIKQPFESNERVSIPFEGVAFDDFVKPYIKENKNWLIEQIGFWDEQLIYFYSMLQKVEEGVLTDKTVKAYIEANIKRIEQIGEKLAADYA